MNGGPREALARAVADVTFRLARVDDAACVGMLATHVFLDTYAPTGIRPALADEVRQYFSPEPMAAVIADPRARVVMAECAGHVIGFAQIALHEPHEHVPEARAPAELRRLYLHPRFTGRGLGRALIRAAEACAAREGVDLLWLTTWVENHRALAFYPRVGYADRGGTLYVFQGERYPNRLFARALAGGPSTIPTDPPSPTAP